MMSSTVRILVINPNSNTGFTSGLEDLVAKLGYSDVSESFPDLLSLLRCTSDSLTTAGIV